MKLGREVINPAKRIYIYNWYRNVFVYDISNTKGDPIPLKNQNLNSSSKAE